MSQQSHAVVNVNTSDVEQIALQLSLESMQDHL